MKKNYLWDRYTHFLPNATKLLLIMKISILFSCVFIMNLSASVYSQNLVLNLDVKNQKIREVLRTIEDQTKLRFFYNDGFLDLNKNISVSASSKSINDVLNDIFSDTNVTYKILDNNFVVITPTENYQGVKVTGNVIDEQTGEPLAGVNVVIEGTTIGVITDIDGNYTLTAPNNSSVLVFSFVGYLDQKVSANQGVVNIKLIPDVKNLEEVVVVGYGTSKKSDITGSVASVNTQAMMKKAPTNILEGIKGQAAGVVVSSQDGAPEANSAVYIRGIATINGTSKPLYVIDGVQVGDNANFLNPSDVERMEVLKDASATAIYGSAGANGVIMITTKHGKEGKTNLSFSADYGVQTLARKLDVTDANQYGINLRTARLNDGNGIVNPIFSEQYDGKRKNIDWQDEMTRISLKQQYNLSASGGTEKTQSSFSVGYLNHDGLVINTNMNRITGRANVVTKVANFLEIGGDLNFVHTENHGSNVAVGNNGNLSSLSDMAWWCPTMDYVDASGTYVSPNVINANGTYGVPIQGPTGTYDALIASNIVATQKESNGKSKNNKMILSAYANINLFKGLTFKTLGSYVLSTGGFQNFRGNVKRYLPDGVTEVAQYNYDARYEMDVNNNQYNDLAIENYLTYNWKNDNHNLTLMAGNSISKSFGSESSAYAKDFPGDNVRDISLTSDNTTRTGNGKYTPEGRRLSYFGRATYSLMDRYILTGTIRRDGSSNFGVDNLWGTFPSAALAWRISEESFLKNNPTITNLKLRLGWGQTGNAGNIGNRATASLNSKSIQYFYYPAQGTAQAGFNSNLIVGNGFISSLVDTKLKWETNEQTNIGIDLGLLKNLTLTVDYFKRNSKDLLLKKGMRLSAGHSEIYTNYGEIQNTGIEFSLNYEKQINNDLHIGATLTGSSIKNEIKNIGTDQFFVNESASGDNSNQGAVGTAANVHWDGHSIMREGYAIGSFYGYEVEGVFQSADEVAAANADAVAKGHTQYQEAQTQAGDFKYKDINGDGFIDPKDMTILGNGIPKFNYGLNLNASYKNWDFTVATYGVAGVKINSYSAMKLSNMFGSDNGTVPNILNSASDEAWTPENHSNSLSRLSLLDYNRNMRGSSIWVKKGDYFKIGTIQVGYNLSKSLIEPLRLESARLSISVQNVLTISSYNKYGDPEIGQGSVIFTGLDTGRYPMPRIYTFSLNIQF